MKNTKLIEFIETTLEESYNNEYKFLANIYDDFICVDSQDTVTEFYFYLDDGSVNIGTGSGTLTTTNLEAIHKICVAIKNNIFN